ncbi:MAG: Nif11-like leader peptide family natural product precursor [Cyanobacteria bacterium P01_A01_bin.84]
MSKKSVLQLIETAEKTPEILSRLQSSQGAEDILSIASELGYEFSESELLDVMQEKQLSFPTSDLSEEQLEAIAGGKENNTKSLALQSTKADQYVKSPI